MYTPRLLFPTLLWALASGTVVAHDRPPVPADYPSHRGVAECQRQALAAKLQLYNQARLDLGEVLRHLADDPAIGTGERQRLRGYADTLDQMRSQLPPADPDDERFREFDFHLGLVLTSITLFLNTEDDALTARFDAAHADPDSELNHYLVRLESDRLDYMHALDDGKAPQRGVAECTAT